MHFLRRNAVPIILVLFAVSLILSVLGFAQSNDQATSTAIQAKTFAHALAQERRQGILRSCRDQNHRHHKTVKALHKQLTKAEHQSLRSIGVELKTLGLHAHVNPVTFKRFLVRQTAQAYAFEVSLFNAAVPHKNCQYELRQATAVRRVTPSPVSHSGSRH